MLIYYMYLLQSHNVLLETCLRKRPTYSVVGVVRDGVKLGLIPGVVRAPSTLALVLQPLVNDVTSVQSTSGLAGVFRVWLVTRQQLGTTAAKHHLISSDSK